jgi:hypothetical protein
MKKLTRLHFVFSCCGLCVICASALGLRMYFMGWLDLVVLSHATHDAAIVKRTEMRLPSAPAQVAAVVDQNTYLVDRDVFYKSLPAKYVQNKRLEDQTKILAAYEKDSEAFLKRYTGYARTFLFDAVIDAKNMVRVGTFGDGGKWVSDPQSLKPGAVVYSFGVGNEISFDTEMAGLFGCEVHSFDPTPSVARTFANCRPGQPVGKGKFWYHAVGLGPTSFEPEIADELVLEGEKCPVKHLDEFAAELCHTHVDILKIDIEGGEMAALTEILSSGTLAKLSVKQLLVEFHLLDDKHFGSFVHIIGLLRQQGYLLFRKEFNPWDSWRFAEFCFLGTR